jgi:hypothetical protein
MVDISFELQERLQACHEQYVLHFADQVRLTRDVGMLDALLAEVRSVFELASHKGDAAVADAAQRQTLVYEQERSTVVAAQQEAGVSGRAAAHLARRTSLVMHRYTRHFAGRDRPSRDLGLLGECRHDLQALYSALLPLSEAQAALCKQFVDLCDTEAEHIAHSRRQGSAAQQAAGLAAAANTLMETYVQCCMQRRRLAVRPLLLGRLVHQLKALLGGMQTLRDSGLSLPHHGQAVEALQGQLRVWGQEHAHTAAAHLKASVQDRAEALSGELDDLLTAYNTLMDGAVGAPGGHPLRTDMGALCDRMDELWRQLRDLAGNLSAGSEAAQSSIPGDLVLADDALAMLCHRYDSLAS